MLRPRWRESILVSFWNRDRTRSSLQHTIDYLPFGNRQELKIQNIKLSIRSPFSFLCGHMCLSNLDHRIRMLKRLWGFIESTPNLMGRPPTKPPDTWGLTLFLKTSMKFLQKVLKHQLSCQQSTWLVEFALSPPPLINPTPSNRNSRVVSTLNIPTSAHICVCGAAQLRPPRQQSPVLISVRTKAQVRVSGSQRPSCHPPPGHWQPFSFWEASMREANS